MDIGKTLMKKSVVLFIFSVIAFAIYFNSINSPFQFDDVPNISKNSDIMMTELSIGSLKRAALSDVTSLRPVANLSFALNYYISGLDTTSYHVVNVTIHILNAFLIYLIILSLFDHNSLEGNEKEKLSISAILTALIWLVTPINSQPVIYIVQRMTLLMTFFMLLAFFSYLSYKREKRGVYLVLSGLFFVFSFLSKQNSIVFPLIIIIYEFVFVRKGNIKYVSKKERIVIISLLMTLLLPIIIQWELISIYFRTGGEYWDFTMYERSLTQLRVLIFYLSLMVLPLPGRLSIVHDIAKSTSIFSPITTLFSLIFLSAALIFSIVRVKKSPYLSFAILWYFITMSIEAIMPVEMAYEHRIYLPCIFLFGAFVDFTVRRFYAKKRALFAVFICIIIALSVLTGIRGKAWKDYPTLWRDVLSKYPDNPRARHNIGFAYSNEGDLVNAMEWFKKTLEVDPENEDALFGLGYVYHKKNFIDFAEKYYKQALLHTKPGHDIHKKSLVNLGAIYFETGRYEESVNALKDVLKHFPEDGKVHHNLGVVFEKQNDLKAAAKEFKLAVNNGYNTPKALEDALRNLIAINETDEAIALYNRFKADADRLCIGFLVKAEIARGNDNNADAKRFRQSYLTCLKEKGHAVGD